MFVKYQFCRESYYHDPAEWLIAVDYLTYLNDLDYEQPTCNECLWIVPGTYNEED